MLLWSYHPFGKDHPSRFYSEFPHSYREFPPRFGGWSIQYVFSCQLSEYQYRIVFAMHQLEILSCPSPHIFIKNLKVLLWKWECYASVKGSSLFEFMQDLGYGIPYFCLKSNGSPASVQPSNFVTIPIKVWPVPWCVIHLQMYYEYGRLYVDFIFLSRRIELERIFF